MNKAEIQENIRIMAEAINESSLRRRLEKMIASFKEQRPGEEIPDAWRRPETTQGVLTKEQIQAQIDKPDIEQTLTQCGLTLHDDGKAFYLSDDSLIGYEVIPSFGGCTFSRFVYNVNEDGNYKSLNDFIKRHCKDKIYLSTVEEIATYVLTGSKEPVV